MANPNKNFTMVYYYIPEDFDEADSPNVFGINMSQDDLRLSHIKANFPLEGEYYFRFKCKYNTFTVWLDLDNDESKLPLYNSRLFVKATRISWNLNTLTKPKEKLDVKNLNPMQDNNAFSSLNKKTQKPTNQQQEINLNWNPGMPVDTGKKSKKESDLLDFDNLDLRTEPQTKSNKKKKNDDLIDF